MSENNDRYTVGVVASVGTFCLVVLLARVFPFVPLMLFAVPVALTSRYAGRGPTAMTVVLSLIAIAATPFITPEHVTHPYEAILFDAGMFCVVAFAIDSSAEALRKARHDLHRTNQSLARARDAAEDASRAREEMLGIVAHDLRNPLNVVMMSTHLIRETELSGVQREQLIGTMLRSAKRMSRLIDDLLEIVRQESGHMKLDVKDVSVSSLLAQTAEMFLPTALEKRILLSVEETQPDLAVRGDAERIIQVLSNIVGNALKFVPSDGSVVIKSERRGSDCVIAVTDTGPGIAREDLDRLFEKFWQRRRIDNRGVGLGLSIARGIVEAHGGRIWAESRPGCGSTFYFALPATRGNAGLLPVQRSSEAIMASRSVQAIVLTA
jgi:signal transduction histidine kinase